MFMYFQSRSNIKYIITVTDDKQIENLIIDKFAYLLFS